MILIADSGSTNTSWVLIQKDGSIVSFKTEGYNPCYNTKDEIVLSLSQNLPKDYNWDEVAVLAFYGAGCYENKYPLMEDALRPFFKNAKIEIAMDLIASARALLGRSDGFAAILGTGTNSCVYDGNAVVHNIDSLGFLLGDEGSGAYIGKRLIADFVRGYMPKDIHVSFQNTYQLTPDELIDKVYSSPMANRYCASFTLFLTGENKENSYLKQLPYYCFHDFFRNIVAYYPNFTSYTFNSVGSVAWVFREALKKVAAEYGMKVGTIFASPMEGLIKYHQKFKR